jgi:hypothetical protein
MPLALVTLLATNFKTARRREIWMPEAASKRKEQVNG